MANEPENPFVPPAENPTDAKESLLRQLLGLIAISAGAACLFFLVFIGPFAWILRDGLGPDSTDSAGVETIIRTFWTFYWGPATIASGLTAVVAALLRRFLTKSPQ